MGVNFCTRRDFIKGLSISVLTVPMAGCSTYSSLSFLKRKQPNIILIFVDDMGYGDLGCYGNPTIATPNLDRMASEGMKFTQFNVASSVCTPSRAALLTGRLPIRSGLTRVFIPQSPGGIPDKEVTIAELLKDVGYATACIGKWHLGSKRKYLPLNHGFDYYFGIPYSNDMSPGTQPDNPLFKDQPPTPLIRNFTVTNPDKEPDQRYLTKWYTEEAIDFMRANAGKKPFFLYLAHTMPHVPIFASPKFRGKSLRGLYGDVVEELDSSCGEILKSLRRLGLEDNTIVGFVSDNGPWLAKKTEGGSEGLFYEGKVSTWEGGHRVPAIFRWPGKIPAGVTNPAFATMMDLFVTFAMLGGAEAPTDRVIDGVDISQVLFKNSLGREALMFYYFGEELWAVRKGPWKIHVKTTRPASVSTWGEWPIEEHDPPLLFNVEHDPSEKYNIAEKHPDIVKELLKVMKQHKKNVDAGEPQR
ncbi:MAG: sulfatase [Phycisphaerae bacterium]